MYCDMCGKDKNLFRTKIESTYLNVCQECSQHGDVIEKIETPQPLTEQPIKPINQITRGEIIQIVIPNFSIVIKTKREHLGLKQKELASKIAEKESLIHKMEAGHMEPPMELARKLEKFLNITLITQYEEKSELEKISDSGTGAMTIGDMIKIKK